MRLFCTIANSKNLITLWMSKSYHLYYLFVNNPSKLDIYQTLTRENGRLAKISKAYTNPYNFICLVNPSFAYFALMSFKMLSIFFRAAMLRAKAAMKDSFLPPAQPDDHDREPDWLPQTPLLGNDESVEIVDTFNNYMSTLSTFVPNAGNFTPIESRLKTTLNEASKEERRSCVRSAREACKIVCNIVAPNAGDDLLRSVGTLDSEITVSKNLEELMSGYRL